MSDEITEPTPQAKEQIYQVSLRRLARAEFAADRGVKFIELWNGGGIVAMLSFWAVVENVRDSCAAILALIAFSTGLIFTAVVVLLAYLFANKDCEQFTTLANGYFNREISRAELWTRDNSFRDRYPPITEWLSYLAFAAALAGTVAAAVAVLSR